MKKTKIIIIDDNVSLVGLIKEYFKDSVNVEVIKEAYNGLDGINAIEENIDDVDVILLDLIMPKKDGMWVLSQLKERNLNVKTIVQTSYSTPEIISEVSEYGANYFILKPYELVDLENRISDTMKTPKKVFDEINFKRSNLEIVVTDALHELGIPSHIKGYQYIRDSIMLIYEREELIGGITKELYPEIASLHQTTVSRVERAIRHAIEVSCNRTKCEVISKYFGLSVSYEKAKPTNSEFIVTIADKIKLEAKKTGQL